MDITGSLKGKQDFECQENCGAKVFQRECHGKKKFYGILWNDNQFSVSEYGVNGEVDNAKHSEIVEGHANKLRRCPVDNKRFTRFPCSSVSQIYMYLKKYLPP